MRLAQIHSAVKAIKPLRIVSKLQSPSIFALSILNTHKNQFPSTAVFSSTDGKNHGTARTQMDQRASCPDPKAEAGTPCLGNFILHSPTISPQAGLPFRSTVAGVTNPPPSLPTHSKSIPAFAL
jgi:hypothetical protein